MPPKPQGDRAMTSTERVHKFREKQRAAQGIGPTDRQKLNEALREIERLTKALAAKAHHEPAKAATDPIKGEEHFSEKSKQTIADAIRVHKTKLNKIFQTKLGEEVRRRIADADDAVRKENSKLRKEHVTMTMLLQQRMIFTPDEFKTIVRCLHPDNSASSAVRSRAFDLFKQNS